MSSFKILSLDGGGSWSLIQVMALIDCFGANASGNDVLRKFDLVAANSGGSIVLGGLIKNFTLNNLLNLLADPTANKRGKIFVEASFFNDPFAHIGQGLAGIGPKYDTSAKLAGLKAILGPEGERTLTDASVLLGENVNHRRTRLLICAFDYDVSREAYFRSDQDSLAGSFGQHAAPTVVQAIHASTNAPVNYFDAPARIGERRYWDGAVGGYNNPVLAAVIEALTNAARYGTSRSEIVALSIGTGAVQLPRPSHKPHEDPDLVQTLVESTIPVDLRKLASSILDDPPDAATFHAYVALGGRMPTSSTDAVGDGPIVRMNPVIRPVAGPGGNWILPDGLTSPAFKALRGLEMDAIDQPSVELIRSLSVSWLANKVRNQAIRANGTTFDAEIGHDEYRAARARAQSLGLV